MSVSPHKVRSTSVHVCVHTLAPCMQLPVDAVLTFSSHPVS